MSHVHVTRCDNCGTQHEFVNFGTWWRLSIKSPGDIVANDNLDFCKQECLREWLVAAAWTGADQQLEVEP